jgi:hypothetical protein
MVTPAAPSTSNINDRLQCRRHLKAEEVMQLIADIYDRPSVDFRNKADLAALARPLCAKTGRARAALLNPSE